jgi:dTMP kinase
MMPGQGRFITLEGGEGTGKSTLAAALAKRLEARGISCLVTREPGGSPRAEEIRKALLSGFAKDLGAAPEALLFSAARIDHLDTTIRPALAKGNFVVCDRFADSTRAYQGTLGKLDPKFIRALEYVVVGPTGPDLTFVLDLPAAEGLARAARRRLAGEAADRFEREDLAFHEQLRQAFLAIAAAEPQRCIVLDARLPAEALLDQAFGEIERRFLRVPAVAGGQL